MSTIWKNKILCFCRHSIRNETAGERGITELHLAGVCTDICVLHTAVDAYNKGFELVIHQNAVASFNEAGHEWALSHFEQSLGAKVVK